MSLADPSAFGPILVLAPIGSDGPEIARVLSGMGVPARAMASLAVLCNELQPDGGASAAALIIAEEAFAGGSEVLVACLARQPPWSDIPIVVLTAGGRQRGPEGRWALFEGLGNATLLNRPVHVEALQSAVRAAIRARAHQHKTRQHLEALRLTAEELEVRVEERTRLLATLDLGTFMARDLDGTIRFWSEGCARLYGWTAAEAVGRSAHELLHTRFPVPLAEMEATLERNGEWVGDLRHRTRDGRELIVSAHKVLRRDAEGRPAAVLESLTDVTEARRAEAALAASNREAQIAAERVQLALAAGAIIGTWMWDLATNHFTADARFARAFGLDPDICRAGLRSKEVLASVHPDDLSRVMTVTTKVLASGGAYSCEYRVRQWDGVYRWVEANGRVDLAPDGTPLRFPGVLLDIERRRAMEAERDRATALLRTVVEAAPGQIYAKDRQGRITLANGPVLALMGKSWAEVKGRTDLEILDDPAQAEAVMANDRWVMEQGQTETLEELVGTEGGHPRIWLSTKTPLRGAAGRVEGLVGVSVEITERKRAEERLRLMVHELNHRVKNTLAIVQAVALQTLRGTAPAVGRTLEARLLALAAAHDVLTRECWEGADLDDVVAGLLAPHGGREAGRFRVSGPPIRLLPRAALGVAMGLHELATNALKYGALSAKTGHVAIRWKIVPGTAARFRLTWTERGGPPVAPPARRGFGTRLVERSLARDLDGTAEIDFAPEGITCTIDAPLVVITAPATLLPCSLVPSSVGGD